MIHVGIDLHPNNMALVAINSNNEKQLEAQMPTSERLLEDFFNTFSEPVRAVVECTCNWYWLADWCRAHDISLTLAHAKMVKAISYAKVKTDSVDAKTLAELLRADLIPEAHQAGPKRRELRELTRGRLRMTHHRSKLQSALWGVAIKYNVHITGDDWRYLPELQDTLAEQLPSAGSLQAELIVAQISQLCQHIGRIEDEIDEQAIFSESVGRLMEVPGIAKVLAWTILAEVGDISRFPSDRQFSSYSRLVPGSKNSGGKTRHKSGNKDGNKYLRMAFGQAAVAAYTHYKPVKDFYNKIKRRSGKPVARTVVAKELSKIVWHMLTKNQEYKGFKGQPTRVAQQTYWPQPISPNA